MDQATLQAISRLTNTLSADADAPGDLNSTLQRIVNAAKDFFAADLCVIFAINPITGKYRLPPTIAGALRDADNQFRLRQPRAEGRAQEVLQTGVLFVSDLRQDQQAASTFTDLEQVRSFAAIAIRSDHYRHPLAVVYVDYRDTREFNAEDETICRFFAHQVPTILQNIWFLRRYQEVTRIGQEVNQELETIDVLFRKLYEHAAGILDIEHFLMLAIHQPQTGVLDLYKVEGQQRSVLPNQPIQGGCKWVLNSQNPLMVRHKSAAADQLSEHFEELSDAMPGAESLIYVPIMLRAAPLGVLSIQHPQPNVYDHEDLKLLKLLTNHLALAIANIDLFSKLIQVNETGQLLTSNLTSEQILQEIVDKIRLATSADIVTLHPYEQEDHWFQLPPEISGRLLVPDFPRPTVSTPDDMASLAVRHGQSEFARDSHDLYARLQGDVSKRRGGAFEVREQVSSTVAAPLRVGSETVGVLFVNFRHPQRFNAPQRQLIQSLANFAAIAIKNSRLFGAVSQRRIDELETLRLIDQAMMQTLDQDAILQDVLEQTLQHIQADKASILIYDEGAGQLKTVAVKESKIS